MDWDNEEVKELPKEQKAEGKMDEGVKAQAMAKLNELKALLEPEGVSLEDFLEESDEGPEVPAMDGAPASGEENAAKKNLIVEAMKKKMGMGA